MPWIDAMMKDVKTLGDEEEEEVEDSTLDVMETQDEDVQGKEKKEDVVKLIETVVEEYFKDPKTENVEDENVKDSEAEKYGKNRRADIPHATFALLWPLGRKETVETLPWNDTR